MTEIKIINNKKKLKGILEFPLSTIITARRQSGKSYLLRNIIESIWKDYKAIYVYCPTACLSSDWDKFKEKKYSKVFEFIDEPDKDDIREIFNVMKDMKMSSMKSKKKFDEKILLIFDDTTELYNNQKASDIFNTLATKGRHVNISYILTCHQWHWLPTGLRANSCQKIFFKINNEREMENISKEVSTSTANSDDIQNIINSHCKNYNSLLIKDNSDITDFFLLSKDI